MSSARWRVASKSTPPKNGHVFISYSWSTQSLTIRIIEALKKEGIRIWCTLKFKAMDNIILQYILIIALIN